MAASKNHWLQSRERFDIKNLKFQSTVDLALKDPRYDKYADARHNTLNTQPEEINSKKTNETSRSIQGWKWLVLLVSVITAVFLYCLDTNLTSILIPVFLKEFGGADKLPWILVGFSLGAIALVLPIGKLYTLYDAKYLFITFLYTFITGSLICGSSQSMNAMIIGRVIAGAGGIGLYTGVITILTKITTPEERPRYIGLVGICWSMGRVLGALFGGALGERYWRWGFFINVLTCGLFSPVYFMIIPSSAPSSLSFFTRFQNFDIIGSILNAITITGLIMGISFGGGEFEWSSVFISLCFSFSVLSLSSFTIQQGLCFLTSEKNRLFPVAMLRIPKAYLVFVISATCSVGGFVTLEYMSLYFQLVRGESPLGAAVRLLPLILSMAIVMPVAGIYIPKIGFKDYWPILGSILAFFGAIFLWKIQIDTVPELIYLPQITVGAGFALYLQMAYTAMPGLVAAEQKGNAMTMVIISQMGAIAFGLAVSGTIFTNICLEQLETLLPHVQKSILQQAISGASGEFFSTLDADTKDAVVDVLLGAIQTIFLFAASSFGVSLLFAMIFAIMSHLGRVNELRLGN